MCAFKPNQAIERLTLYWFPLLSTNIKVADTIFGIYLKVQSFQSNRSLISGVLLTTGTIQNYKKFKTQKVKVAEIYWAATFTKKYTKNLLWKKFNWILQFSSPLSPRPLLLPCPKCLLTEAWKASSFSPVIVLLLLRWATSWPLRARPPTFITNSEFWAPWAGLLLPDVVDGDLLQEDLSTWMGTTW